MPTRVLFLAHLKVGMGFHREIIDENNLFYWRLFPTKWH